MARNYKVLREACDDWSKAYREPVKSVVKDWSHREEVIRHQEKLTMIDKLIRELDPSVISASPSTGKAILENFRNVSSVARDSIRRTWADYWEE